MVIEFFTGAVEAKSCVFQLSVVKDRERHCLLIALIVRPRGEIICKPLRRGGFLSRAVRRAKELTE
jgi:hypothetical protein